MFNKYLYIIALLFVLCGVDAKNKDPFEKLFLLSDSTKTKATQQGDSIMRNVISSANKYKNILSHYEAEIYIKGRTEILKQNFLMRFAHHLFPVNRKNKDMLFEMVCLSTFSTPNNYTYDFKAINGNSIPNAAKQKEALDFLNLNVYSPTIYNEGIIMPVANEAFRYYRFKLEETLTEDGLQIFRIRFMPKLWSQKLICGDLYIIDGNWRIDKIDVNGRFSFAEFNLIMSFGRDYRHFILPKQADLHLRYQALGNAIETTYHTAFNYHTVEWIEENYEEKKKPSLDLSGYYQISSDTIPIIKDTAYWNTVRDTTLTEEEEKLYNHSPVSAVEKTDTGNMQRYLKITERLTNTINLDYNTTRLKYSGILNPFQLGYSGRNGITYKQQLRLSKTFAKDRQLRFRPEIGYVFKRKELFFKFTSDWEYLPERLGTLSFTAANANQSYSSKIMKEINEQLKDSTFNFDNLDLQYFKHYFIELKNQIELFNGFQLITGISYHRRVSSNKVAIDPGEDVSSLINENYHDFIPAIGFSYTPRQYYWMDGYRKEYLYSYYPTISVEFARAIPGIWSSTGNYDRIEADIHQSIYLGLTRRFNYHLSGGMYTHQKTTYFADFTYFTKRNFPDSWGRDDFGGVFHQLKGEWFNAADKYFQAHFMYESPFMILQKIKPEATKHIPTERFYLSQLWTPVLPSYTEIGYGFGNHIFNVAVFAGFDRWKYDGIGFKFAFELFQ